LLQPAALLVMPPQQLLLQSEASGIFPGKQQESAVQ
jgi:hypothetical protein